MIMCQYKSYSGIYSDDLVAFVALFQFVNHFSDADEIRNSKIEMQPEYYNAFVCESLNERYKIMRNKLPIDPIVEDGKDYFYNQRGAKVYKDINKQNKYVSVMQNLQDNGLDTVKLDTLMEQRNNKKEEIDRILIKEKQLCKLEEEYESLESVYRNKVDIIYKLRNNFIQEVIGNDKNVKFQLAKNRNRNSFINNLKAIMQKEITSVDDDINELADLYFKKEDGIEKYKKMLISIRNKEDQKSLSKKTRDIITSIAEDSFARMIAFIPDDDLIVSYRPEKAKKFIPLSNASAGQKTTTILTFLLAYGNQPLLLDQPEDDLDNRLVYDLIVARLKVAKSKRQIIVVTHNANIPVNGDSEYIISMDSETDIIQVNQTGTMDDESIRQEICDVMEGTKDAFEMRAKKYHFNIKE